jgi:hypothetical protein
LIYRRHVAIKKQIDKVKSDEREKKDKVNRKNKATNKKNQVTHKVAKSQVKKRDVKFEDKIFTQDELDELDDGLDQDFKDDGVDEIRSEDIVDSDDFRDDGITFNHYAYKILFNN